MTGISSHPESGLYGLGDEASVGDWERGYRYWYSLSLIDFYGCQEQLKCCREECGSLAYGQSMGVRG